MNEASRACGVCVHVEGRSVDEQMRFKYERRQYHTDCVATVLPLMTLDIQCAGDVVAVPSGGLPILRRNNCIKSPTYSECIINSFLSNCTRDNLRKKN